VFGVFGGFIYESTQGNPASVELPRPVDSRP